MLRPCILAHLMSSQTVYGYELHHWLLGIGVECDPGTVYRSLNTMEAEGLLRSTWERTPGGRSRRRYELSEHGLDMVDAYVAPVEQLRSVAQEFLDMRRCGSGGLTEAGAGEADDPIAGDGSAPFPGSFSTSQGAARLSISAPRG